MNPNERTTTNPDGVAPCDEAQRLIAEYEALTLDTRAGSWCDRVLSFLRRTTGVPGCSHCYDGGCGDPLGCGETDRRAAGVKTPFENGNG